MDDDRKASASPIRSYQDLQVWQMAIDIIEHCYELTTSLPRDELYGLTSQVRRASVSIAANIAEGFGREQTGSFIQFLRISQGSNRELETHHIIARRLKMADPERVTELLQVCERISKMLRALVRSLEARQRATP
jgi:four helix bundle protein